MNTRIDPLNQTVLFGEGPAMQALRKELATAVRSQAKVLALGETGVGKEVVARFIHHNGVRRNRPFFALNCSGIPETLLESELFGHLQGSFTGAYRDKPGLIRLAADGTLFLDELGEMSLRMQAVLLRFTETGELQPVGGDGRALRSDVRLITATNRDLRAQIEGGTFRKDLYYRLNVIEIHVPPLRERGDEDIRLLLHHFLKHASEQHKVPCPDLGRPAEELLLRHAWPGNVRELKNVTERLVIQLEGRPITPDALPSEIHEPDARAAGAQAPALLPEPGAPGPGRRTSAPLEDAWARLQRGEDFWSTIHQPFKSHDFTRDDVREVVRRGLAETHGNYRRLVAVFHMPPSDYKRFLAFLSQHQCNVPYKRYREEPAACLADAVACA